MGHTVTQIPQIRTSLRAAEGGVAISKAHEGDRVVADTPRDDDNGTPDTLSRTHTGNPLELSSYYPLRKIIDTVQRIE